jgi:hypothetical protein
MHAWVKNIVFCVGLLWLTSCVPNPTRTSPKVTQTLELSSIPTQKITLIPTLQSNTYWKEFREWVDGWGIAVPIDWEIDFSYAETKLLYLKIRNFTSSFYQANSENGNWKNDVIDSIVSIQFSLLPGATGYTSLEDAFIKAANIDNEYTKLISIKEIAFNNNPALEFRKQDVLSGNISEGYIFRINEDKLLQLFLTLDSVKLKAETLAILNSIVLQRERKIILPSWEPSNLLTLEG